MKRTNSPLTLFSRTLAAGPETAPGKNGLIDATGTKIFVKSALQPFKVKLDTGESFDMEDGFSYEMDGGDFFSRIELINPNAVALAVQLYVGNARIFRAAPLFGREAPTSVVVYKLTAVATVKFPSAANALRGAGKHRKQIVFSTDSAGVATIYPDDGAGAADTTKPIANMGVSQSLTLFTSDILWVAGVSGVVYVTETFYT